MAARTYLLDTSGRSLGYLNERGVYFDLHDVRRGVQIRRTLYTADLTCLGSFDEQGHLLDGEGHVCGRLCRESSGSRLPMVIERPGTRRAH